MKSGIGHRAMLGMGAAAMVAVSTIGAAKAAQCYHASEIEAEQAVRFQAKVMVLSDTCGAGVYQHFMQHNGAALVRYQREMIEFFRRGGGGRAESRFDSFITRVANELALVNGRQILSELCTHSADLLTQADGLVERDFHELIATEAVERRGDYRSCDGGPVKAVAHTNAKATAAAKTPASSP